MEVRLEQFSHTPAKDPAHVINCAISAAGGGEDLGMLRQMKEIEWPLQEITLLQFSLLKLNALKSKDLENQMR